MEISEKYIGPSIIGIFSIGVFALISGTKYEEDTRKAELIDAVKKGTSKILICDKVQLDTSDLEIRGETFVFKDIDTNAFMLARDCREQYVIPQ